MAGWGGDCGGTAGAAGEEGTIHKPVGSLRSTKYPVCCAGRADHEKTGAARSLVVFLLRTARLCGHFKSSRTSRGAESRDDGPSR